MNCLPSLVASCAAAVLLTGCVKPSQPIMTDAPTPPPPAPSGTPPVSTPLESALFEHDTGWIAGDGAASVDLGDGRTLWTFGDTLIGSLTPEGRVAEGTVMINNSIALSTTSMERMEFRWIRRFDGSHASWVQSPAQLNAADTAHWLWPTGGGIRVQRESGDHVVLFYAMLRRRHQNPGDDVWNFALHGTSTVTLLNPGDPPSEWRTEVGTLVDRQQDMDLAHPVRLISWGTSVVPDPEDPARVLVYGADVSNNLNKRMVLARAPLATLERLDTWAFRTTDGWSEQEADAAPLADGVMDEFSVHKQAFPSGERYVLICMKPFFGPEIEARTAPAPAGPWSEPVSVYTCPEPAQDSRVIVYSARAHPELTSKPGTLLVTYCVNSTDFRHMLANARLYRPRMVRVPLETMLGAGAGPTRR